MQELSSQLEVERRERTREREGGERQMASAVSSQQQLSHNSRFQEAAAKPSLRERSRSRPRLDVSGEVVMTVNLKWCGGDDSDFRVQHHYIMYRESLYVENSIKISRLQFHY